MTPATAHTNLLLAGLNAADGEAIAPLLTPIDVARGFELASARAVIGHVYFMDEGVASVVSRTARGTMVEVGIFGPEGFGPVAPLLGAEHTPLELFIQSETAALRRIETPAFRTLLDQRPAIRLRLLRYVQTFLIQTAGSATSNAHQRIEARLARWLLMCHDRVTGDEVRVTHEFMAMMIAADRSSVTIALHGLEGMRLIRSLRGRVVIRDRRGLVELAGDGYGQAEREYDALIGPFGKDG